MEKKYSGKQINKAGDYLRDFDNIFDDEKRLFAGMDVISYWRLCHAGALETAFDYIQSVVRKIDQNAIFAKRLKRHVSICMKLVRFETMKLKNMQDIGGARAILPNYKKLKKIVRILKKSQYFRVESKKIRFKDYIQYPKEDGYRSYHMVGKFKGNDGINRNIEIQLRTNIQHYWATAVEIVDLFTDQALKSNQGDVEWKNFFINVSEQFSVMDNIHLFKDLNPTDQGVKYLEAIKKKPALLMSCKVAQNYCRQLDVFGKLEAFAGSLQVIEDRLHDAPKETGFVLIKINHASTKVMTKIFHADNINEAEKEYIETEKEAASEGNFSVALVSTDAVGDIKIAYPNYFADSSEFLKHLTYIQNAFV